MNKIIVENVNHPGYTESVDAAKYGAMREALMAVLESTDAPMSVLALKAAIARRLPQQLFPEGATAGWWIKTVQLDLEAKGLLARTAERPLRLYLDRKRTLG